MWIIGRRCVRILGPQKFDACHRGIILENLPQQSIDLDCVVAGKIPRRTDIAGSRLHHQSTDVRKEFENLLERLARSRIDCPKTVTGEHDLPRTISWFLRHGFNISSVIESLPVFSAARAMPDLPTLIFSAYCSGMRGDFHPPAWVIAARSMSRAARS